MKESIYLWKYYSFKLNTRGFYRELLRNQLLSKDEIEAISWAKTKKLIQYVFQNVPYYRDKYKKAGIHPNDIKTPSDFKFIPLLTKEDIRTNLDKMISREASLKDLNMVATGGSTGQVLKLYHQKNVPRAAIGWRMYGWWGLAPCCDSAWVWRMANPSFLAQAKMKFIDWPAKSIRLNAAQLDETTIRTFITEYNKSKTELINGYVGAVDYLASFILKNNLSVRVPKAVSVTASPITAVQEKRIERAFCAPVYDQYGCCEVYWLAAQYKERKALHRFHDVRRIEFLDNNDLPCDIGTEGQIAVTDLESYYFPIIRYLNGDYGKELPGVCTCGVNLPLMSKVQGRVSENINLPDGTVISGPYLTTIFDSFPEAVKQFQVHQQSNGDIYIKYVPAIADDELKIVIEKINHKFLNDYGGQFVLRFIKVNEIPHDRGKLRYIISDYKG
jgi:phenylacetate-CoA ligase